MSDNVLVIGSGGIGSFYGALLHKAGWQVDMVARSDHSIIQQQGVTIDSVMGDLSFTPNHTYAKIAAAGVADWLLVSIKILPNTDLARLLAPVIGPNTKICLIANGLDIEIPLANAFPTNTLISCVAFVGATRLNAGHVKHNAYGDMIISNYFQENDEHCQRFAETLNSTGINVQVCPDINIERWKKSIWNASFNPLSVATNGADTGKMLATPESEHLVRQLMAEVIATARAQGYDLPDDLIDKNIATTRKMPPYLTSMAQDYLNGNHIELDALVGSVVQYAKRHNVSVPHLNTLYQTLKLRYSY